MPSTRVSRVSLKSGKGRTALCLRGCTRGSQILGKFSAGVGLKPAPQNAEQKMGTEKAREEATATTPKGGLFPERWGQWASRHVLWALAVACHLSVG